MPGGGLHYFRAQLHGKAGDNGAFPQCAGRVLEKAGGAKVLLEGEFDAASLLELAEELLSDQGRLESMSDAMKSLALPDATDRICRIILDMVN